MRSILTFLFMFLQLLPVVRACNISDNELLLRLTFIKSDGTQTLSPMRSRHEELPETGLSHHEFNQVIEAVKKTYAPIFKKIYANFKIESQWEDKQVNAFAGVRGRDRYLLVYGGYARHPLMTRDAFLSVLCHEVGHHLGGFPKKSAGSWSSTEGQADYFSTLKCMKEVLRGDDDNMKMALSLDLPVDVKLQCLAQFSGEDDYLICLRSAKAAEEHGRVIADIDHKGQSSAVSLLTPSTEIVTLTNVKHPEAQCRLDTKYQGALCNVPASVPLDNEDETKGTCNPSISSVGARPACWFVPRI